MLYKTLKGRFFLACCSLLFTLNTAIAQDRPTNPFNYTPFSKDQTSADLLNKLSRAAPAANPKVIGLALSALNCALTQGMSPARNLTVIDYSLVSTKPRLWVFDLVTGKLLFQELVAHGMKTGKNFARNFSNTTGSHQTSLGLFLTKETYMGANGYSLRMEGLEDGFNDKAMERAIVFHGADYVDLKLAKKLGHLGRSHGCPAVRRGIARKVIDTIKGEQFLFSYYPDRQWLANSQFLNCPDNGHLAQK
ncbi:murein L,D-transpeptidase catalytic domain family protein [Cellvibrio sp. OA-2007]|uniref:murein L,D-transpeptidase catalytic domain family protein n=1 Tax=Cellvibrio sp. OA-2007 TaxID=529823 RepID=UPI000784BC84|nr:murein L,D-transpeptidase catalytic domain family protein [Cellvibrio sp. OA-2007]